MRPPWKWYLNEDEAEVIIPTAESQRKAAPATKKVEKTLGQSQNSPTTMLKTSRRLKKNEISQKRASRIIIEETSQPWLTKKEGRNRQTLLTNATTALPSMKSREYWICQEEVQARRVRMIDWTEQDWRCQQSLLADLKLWGLRTEVKSLPMSLTKSVSKSRRGNGWNLSLCF